MNSKTFCIVPWTHVRIVPSGNIFPCCKINKEHVPEFNINTIDNFDQYWNSDYLKNLRRDLTSGVKPEQCKNCWRDEEANKPSRRQETNKHLTKHVDIRKILKSQNWISDTLPVSWDLSLSNICNFKCVMCTPILSSRIQTERKLHKEKFLSIVKQQDLDFDGSWPEKSLFQDLMARSAGSMKILALKGGEPLLVKNIMNTIKSVENKHTATLAVNTNGSVEMSEDFLHEIEKFEKNWIVVSVDGVDAEGEYVRHGCDWKTVEKNIHKLSQIKNCTLRLNVVLQFFSPATFPGIFEFANKHNYEIEVLYCATPEFLSINSILPDTLEEFKIWAKEKEKEHPSLKYLSVLNNYLDQYKFDPSLHKQCQKYVDTLDSIRGNRLESIQKLFVPKN